jgi:hypothetical protein
VVDVNEDAVAGALIGEHAVDLLGTALRHLQCPRLGRLEQDVVWRTTPEKV